METKYIKCLFLVFILLFSPEVEAKRASYFRLRGEQKFLEGRYAEALELFASYEEEEDIILDELYLHRKAESYYKLGRFDHALITYEQVLETNPEMANYVFLKGLIQRSSLVYYYSEMLERIDNILNSETIIYTSNDDFELFRVEPFHAMNTEYSEFGAVEFQGRIYLSSITDRRFAKKNVNTNLSHYNIYSADAKEAHNLVDFGGKSYESLTTDEKKTLDVAREEFEFVFEDEINTSYNNGPISFLGDDIAYVTVNQEYKKRNQSVFNLTLNQIVLSDDPTKVFDEMGEDYFGQYFSPADVGQITFSKDQQKACMAVKLKDSPTKSDLWFANRLPSGKWDVPYLAGDIINTSSDDLFPYWSHDDYLYYSTAGLQANGGLDVYRVDLLNPTAVPQNAGVGINTSFDDFAFSIDSLGSGYLTSNRVGGRGQDDIYIVSKRRGHIKVVLSSSPRSVDNPLFDLIDSRKSENIADINILEDPVFVTEALEYGEYDVNHILPVDSHYQHVSLYEDTVIVYIDFKEKPVVSLPVLTNTETPVETLPVIVKDYEVAADTLPVTFTNFCFNCDEMDEANAYRFTRIITFFKEFPEIEISLTGNTDVFGADAYNEVLGMRRADLMEKWLREAGIKNKIRKATNGERKTISDIDHRLNRRVDIELFWPGDPTRIEFVSADDPRLDFDLHIEYDFAQKHSKELTPGYYILLHSSTRYMAELTCAQKYGFSTVDDILLYSSETDWFNYYYNVAFRTATAANKKIRQLKLDGDVVYLDRKKD